MRLRGGDPPPSPAQGPGGLWPKYKHEEMKQKALWSQLCTSSPSPSLCWTRVLQCREACLLQTRSTGGGFWNTDQLTEERPEREEEKTDLQNGLLGWGQELRAHGDLCLCNTACIHMLCFCHLQLKCVYMYTCLYACVWTWAEHSRMCWDLIMKNTAILNSSELFSYFLKIICTW